MAETSSSLPNQSYSLAYLANFLGATVNGDSDVAVVAIATLTSADDGEISFLANPQYKKYLATTKASAVILSPDDAAEFNGNALITNNPYLAYARLSELFTPNLYSPGIHASAVVHPSVEVGDDVCIGANAVVEANTKIGNGSCIGPGTVIGANCVLGEKVQLAANVSIYHKVRLGNRVIIHSGVVVGGDGFGFAEAEGKRIKIHQLGGVVIGDDVEIGAGSCIDRGALDDTILESGVKLDNLVQVAHNAIIGENSIMCGCSGVAGSTTIGPNCIIGGAVGIIGHLTIAANVTVTAGTLVTKSISEPGYYSSGTPMMTNSEWRKNAATFPRLYTLYQNLKKMEKNRT